MSDNIIEQIQSKQELIEKIQKWVTLDSQLKIVNEKTKQMREMKGMNKTRVKTGIDNELTTRLKNIIVAVDGESGRATINNFVDTELFAMDSRALRSHIKSISPDLDMTFTFVSDATGEVKEMDIPMGVSFFWPSN